MAAHTASALLQQRACGALYSLATHASLRQRIKTAGGAQHVQHAISASKATKDTKKWGKVLLEMLFGDDKGSLFFLMIFLLFFPLVLLEMLFGDDKGSPSILYT
jgi:hypothetical protein